MYLKLRLLQAVSIVMMPAVVFAHGGGLDKNGCHTNRKTGEYHCHGASVPQSSSLHSATSEAAPRVDAARALRVQPSSSSSDKDLVKAVQILLQALGYRPSLLGSIDDRTRRAILAFQAAQGLQRDGVVSSFLALRLSEAVANKCK